MPKINILNILSGDNQSTIVDKINYNFDQILSSGGGPQGQQGLIGATGPVGPQGIPGIQGAKGDKGNKWFVDDQPPIDGSLGDFWLDVDSADQTIYEYDGTSWISSNYGLSSGDIFQKMNYIIGAGDTIPNKTAVILGGLGSGLQSTKSTSLVLSDSPITSAGAILGYGPGTPPAAYIKNVNQENSKLKIATEGRTNLISFSRSNLDVSNPNLNGSSNPTISWLDPGVTSNPYDIAFNNPVGGISILTTGLSRGPIDIKSDSDSVFITSTGSGPLGGVNILSDQEITNQSNSENISVFTAASNKGTFIRFNATGGFIELNYQPLPTAPGVPAPVLAQRTNSSTPAFFANATGVGIGVGKLAGSTFKQTGADPRKLAVLGNVSISKQGIDHESVNMFIGAATTDTTDYDKGALLVRGYGAFGHNDPRFDLGSGLTTTGPSELANNFPKLFVAGSRRGQTFQVKTGSSSGFISRTTLGDGFNDYNAFTDKTSAGFGPDLTQEFFVSNYNFTAAPLISLQHKITNATNVTDTATVFSISTSTIAGAYNSETIADKTLIQTKNSNSNLRLFANATSTTNKDKNKVIIGARDKPLIAVYAGTDTNPELGTVTIGPFGEGTKGLIGPHDSTRVTFPLTMINSHSLSVPGALTIGTNNSYSAWSTFVAGAPGTVGGNYGINSSRPVGNSSMLKINRTFADTVTSFSGNIGGNEYNNLPNGLEIISFKNSTQTSASTVNRSVAIAVGAIYQRNRPPAGGFFVSDDGNNAAIGSLINYSVALNVSGTVNATTSVTTPIINAGTSVTTPVLNATTSVTTGILTANNGIFTNGTNISGGTGKGILLWDTGTGASEGLFLDWRSGTNGVFAGIVGYSEASGGGIRFYTTNNNNGSQGSINTRTLRMSIAANGDVSIPGAFVVSRIESNDSINVNNPNAFLGINTYYGSNLPSDSNNTWRAKQAGNGMWFKIEDSNTTNGRLELRTFGNTSAGAAATSYAALEVETKTGGVTIPYLKRYKPGPAANPHIVSQVHGWIFFTYNWNNGNNNGFTSSGYNVVGSPVTTFTNTGAVAVKGVLRTGSITDPSKCVVTACFGGSTSYEVVQRCQIRMSVDVDSVTATLFKIAADEDGDELEFGNTGYTQQVYFTVTQYD